MTGDDRNPSHLNDLAHLDGSGDADGSGNADEIADETRSGNAGEMGDETAGEIADEMDDEIGRLLPGLAVRGEGSDMTDLLARVNRRAEAEGLVDVAWAVTDSPIGRLTLAATPAGLVRLSFGEDEAAIEDLATRVSPRVLRSPGRLDEARRQLDEYFEGRRHEFDLPLDWQLSRGFRRLVLGELVRVPYGRTVSYKELAERAGNPKASRAAGTAMATNPIAIVVPCHRCLRTGGDLGGYGGGLDAKVWLLHLEGARLVGG